jgi:predicted anti-sigma-YlaC factor YlaD
MGEEKGLKDVIGFPVLKLYNLVLCSGIYLSFSLSVLSGGAISSLMAGHTFDITGSYQLIFLIYAVLAIMSLMQVSLLKPTRKESLR